MFQLILNPTRDWNARPSGAGGNQNMMFQLILNPTRDWNSATAEVDAEWVGFQLILNPTRDWNGANEKVRGVRSPPVPINLKPY